MKRNLLTTLLLIVLPLLTIAQGASKITAEKGLEKQINKAFLKIDEPVFTDSVAVYSFLFNIEVSKTKGNKATVTKLSVSDSLAYRIFPNYEHLYNIDFKAVLKDKKKVNLILPVLMFGATYFDRPHIKYLQNNGTLLGATSISDLFKKSFSSMLPPDEMWLEDVVLFKPNVIHIFHAIYCGVGQGHLPTPSAAGDKLTLPAVKL